MPVDAVVVEGRPGLTWMNMSGVELKEPFFQQTVDRVFREATLTIPKSTFAPRGGRTGRHTEHLGRMLADMQSLARAHPGASW